MTTDIQPFSIEPYRIDVAQTDVDDLLDRLARTRRPEPVPGDQPDWSRGIPGSYLHELAEIWRTSYDWRKAERALNAFPQFVTEIDGQTIHFIHVRSPEPDATPLLISHGYPGSVAEFLELLGPLSDPASYGGDPRDAFHLVVPSLPGFGFSTPLSDAGWEVGRTTAAFAELMTRLGYERFGAQGGDVGAGITGRLGALHPERVIGTHVNSDRGMLGLVGDQLPMPDGLSDDEQAEIEAARTSWKAADGYLGLQSNTPETIAPMLTDSPVAQLAWVAEKLLTWTNHRKAPADTGADLDRVLTIVSIYWFTRSGATAARFLYEAAHSGLDWVAPAGVPAGWAVFDTHPLMRKVCDPWNASAHWTEFDEGGHFAALEAGELLVSDVRAFFRTLRS